MTTLTEASTTMTERDYTTVLTVPTTPDAAYAAVNDVRGWWSQDVDGATDVVGAEFDYRGNQGGVNLHRARIRVTDLEPGRRVEWHVRENWMSFIADQAEWTGTRIVFEISPTAEGTQIRFTHHGLVPSYECYDVCFDAWTFFVQDSLRALITTGRGEPMARLTPEAATA
jgi:Activator of Hsp90 ATPase homolog 1-like protein